METNLDEMSMLAYLIGTNAGAEELTIPTNLAVRIVLKLDKLKQIEKIINEKPKPNRK